METLLTSTSYIDISSESGSMPWLIVRFDCGSRSTQRTRLPFSANATARFSVVVVFATPPFWLANEITWAFGPPGDACDSACGVVWAAAGALITDEGDGGNAGGLELFRSNRPIRGSVFGWTGGFPSRQTARFRDGQGRGRQDDRRRMPRAGRGTAWQARDRVRGRRGGNRGRRGRGGARNPLDRSRSRAGDARVPDRSGRRSAVQGDDLEPHLHVPGSGGTWAAGIADDREGLGPRAARSAPHRGDALRLGRPRRARDRARPGHAANAAHVPRRCARRPDLAPGRPDRWLPHQSRSDRDRRGGCAGGDAGQRNDRLHRRARRRDGPEARRGGGERRLLRSFPRS